MIVLKIGTNSKPITPPKKTKLHKVKFNFKNAGSIVVNMPIMDKRKKSNEKKKHHHH